MNRFDKGVRAAFIAAALLATLGAFNADDKMRAFFGGKSQVTMFDLAKLANKHLS